MERRKSLLTIHKEDIGLKTLSSVIRLNEILSGFSISQENAFSLTVAEISRIFNAVCSAYLMDETGSLKLIAIYQPEGAIKTSYAQQQCIKDCHAVKEMAPRIFTAKNPCPHRHFNIIPQVSVCDPVVIGDKVIGVVTTDFLDREALSADEFNLLISIINLLTTALHRYSLYTNLLSEKEKLQRAYEELKLLQKQLLESQKLEALGRLAGGIAHDFNNILTALTGYSELAYSSIPEKSTAKEYLKKVLNASDRAKSLTSQILAFSRRQPVNLSIVNLNNLLLNFKDILKPLVTETVEIKLSLSSDMPSIMADPHQIEQVIMNLAINAKDAMTEGGTITIKTENKELAAKDASALDLKAGRYALLSISDTGAGIPEEVKDHIFEPFFTTKDKGKGTGLGLAVVYGIIKQHNGAVTVESKTGEGTTFTIYMPHAAKGDIRRVLSERTGDSGRHRGSGNILIVEDDKDVASLISSLLSDKGYSTTMAVNGEEALKIVQIDKEKKYHLLIADIVMPLMSGKRLAEKMREIFPEIKVLFISGYPDSAELEGKSGKGTAFLQKPFNPGDLSEKVRELLAASSLTQG